MKVYLQVNNKGLPLDYDHFNAAYGFREMGFEIVEFETYDTLKKSEINDVIVGYSGPIETRLYDFGVRIPDIDYPESISGYLGRKIWKSTINTIKRGIVMTTNEKALEMHKQWNGKLSVEAKCQVASAEDLAIAYTPGVAEPCKVIAKDPEAAYTYTMKSNTVAVVSDGSAVLGLGNIGALAAMPVMEGKAVLFKEFGNVNAVPICLDTQDTEEIIKAVTYLAPGFGGINLEDISAPRCFEIEERLKEILDIPVFHDDQHGTAIVVLAGVINALKVVGKKKEDCRVVVNGAGSAGVAITKLLLTYGFPNIIMCDKVGIVSKDTEGLNWMQKKMTEVTNLNNETGSLADALKGADIFIGVSAPNIVTPEMVASMNRDSILFAMANPVPEIMPDVAKAAGARVVGTGRSDFPNQVNNVVAFPGIFKGALEGRATQITEEMKLAAAEAIAGLVPADKLSDDNIMPEAFDPQVAEVVADAVKSHIR